MINVNKLFFAGTLALFVMGGLNLAHAQDGTMTFTGKISDSACTIATASKDITVDFGEMSSTRDEFVDGGVDGGDTSKHFNINLTDCPVSVDVATVSMTGEVTNPTYLNQAMDYVDGVASSTSSWVIAAGDSVDDSSTNYHFDGSNPQSFDIQPGENVLPQTARFVAPSGDYKIGTHTGAVTYTITYQ